ncbi:hypothetical protein PF005_g29798 [Phytophthora fragariae]|uniref:Uncharacterized protein n=1 Tax=Phytophthora fragariae TaxID=53985 RepID=A0A6A4B8D0_9STRA|nr:hypothetical protein PF005_g29798 [Phytophthora fragariae]KAE9268805.1 hypothetical protein PF001_g29507 [Phytophthora fragariae]
MSEPPSHDVERRRASANFKQETAYPHRNDCGTLSSATAPHRRAARSKGFPQPLAPERLCNDCGLEAHQSRDPAEEEDVFEENCDLNFKRTLWSVPKIWYYAPNRAASIVRL